MKDYDRVLMVATSLGIASLLPYLEQLAIDGRGADRGSSVHLVWADPSATTLEAEKYLNRALHLSLTGPNHLKVSIYEPSSEKGRADVTSGDHGRATTYAGRPDLKSILAYEVAMIEASHSLLVTVPSEDRMRNHLQDLVRPVVNRNIEFVVLDHQLLKGHPV